MNTLVNFRPAQPSKTGQFSTGVNNLNSKGSFNTAEGLQEDEIKKNSDRLIALYWSQLDEWAESKETDREKLIEKGLTLLPEACSNLVMAYWVGSGRSMAMNSEERSEWEFNVDLCMKATMHRHFPQPEFENKQIVKLLCHDNKDYDFNYQLCERAGLYQ